jgi:methylmalonyl-CoA mutase N-terminal domain/subunit
MSETKKRSDPVNIPLPEHERARARWRRAYEETIATGDSRHNRSGIEIAPLYTPDDVKGGRYMTDLGFPGEYPYTRGIYPTMHRGRTWSQRQLIGFSTPEAFNERQKLLIAGGATAINFIPCNSVFRGYDMDMVDREILGTCGTLVNTAEDMGRALADLPLDKISVGLNDPSPFTLSAFFLAHAKRIGMPWNRINGTSNQSDYISHFIANHMFFRLALSGARRVLLDEIAFMRENVPGWNPLSVVGQHMQQAGATPAEAMGFTLSSAIQSANDCIGRDMDPDTFLPRFSFFFDISLSFFEEVAKFRAGRRIWARIARERLGARDPKSWRFRFHGQTSGVDLTAQQPLNNIARVAVQGMAGILGGLQSLHTDSYDEVLSTPTDKAALIAINTQNILRDEAHLTDVIDPLGGSYYVEALTDAMEEKIEQVIATIDDAGGMYAAAESGLVQSMIGKSAMAFQSRIESGEQKWVGVNAYKAPATPEEDVIHERPDPEIIDSALDRLARFKAERDNFATRRALDRLARAAESADENVYAEVVNAAEANATHGEIVKVLRDVLGFGQPLIVV